MLKVTTTLYTRQQQAKDAHERNAWFLKANGREMTYEDVIKSWGGRMSGGSQLTRERSNSRSSDDGVKDCT